MSKYSLFSVIGLEIEYMLVDKNTLDVQAKSDEILTAINGQLCNEAVVGDIVISNELVLHVLELKNNGPKPINASLVQQFQTAIETLQPVLNERQLQFLPGGAHPWMDPNTETRRWPHGNKAIYQQFDKIFNCKGHGWSNLQSMHVNLPFANDSEFFQLHTAIRLILPLLPALAASSPFLDGQYTGYKDARLSFYTSNQQTIPEISGDIIPEFIRCIADYQSQILEPMYKAIAPHDPEKILQQEWLNSRGAIPKFNWGAIEIRLLDSQECVQADVAIALAIVAILKKWLHHSHYFLERPCDLAPLKDCYQQSIKHGLESPISQQELYAQWQISPKAKTLGEVWEQLIEQVSHELDFPTQRALETILSQGNLSDRLMKALGKNYTKADLMWLYRQLGTCLLGNQQFT